MKSNDDNKSMFQYLELHRKFVVDLYSSTALTFMVPFLVNDNIYGEKVEANEDENGVDMVILVLTRIEYM
ncbi:hypothetical protein PS2_003572 [Malus domestica]